jgi:hypothetical protein
MYVYEKTVYIGISTILYFRQPLAVLEQLSEDFCIVYHNMGIFVTS